MMERISKCQVIVALFLIGISCSSASHESPLSLLDVESSVLSVSESCSITVLSEKAVLMSDDWVQVTVQCDQPHTRDLISVYSPAIDVTRPHLHAPIKYKKVAKACDESYLITGTCTTFFSLVNMRSDYTFAIVRGGLTKARVVAWTDVVSFANINEPLQAHVSLTTKPSSLR